MARCTPCMGKHLSRLHTWEFNTLTLPILCFCGILSMDQSLNKSFSSLRPGFRASDSNAESVEVAYSFGICYLSANPCQRLHGFAAQLAELLASCSLIQLRLEAQVSKAQKRQVFKQEPGTLRSLHRSAEGRARQLPSAGRTPARPGGTVPSRGSPPGSAPGAAAGAGGVSFRGIVGRRDAAGASPGAPRAGRAGGSRQPAGPGRLQPAAAAPW